MKVLLDTHALLWALTNPARLGGASREALSDRATDVWVSAASAWEIATKQRLGKLPGVEAITAGWSHHLRDLGARELPISSEHALLSGQLNWDHRDRFDRMLAAQSLVESMTLVSRDPQFGRAPGVAILW
ncbi:type II toxin-antitoxin system VapC family toxin [Knoellia sp. CPCC 206453]|uniref:type II toxin-antitoxin system VapC family toxin n=1 Tax=Knoellia pratensis TaxID=3404796 RepID=UPI00360757D4